MLRSSPDFRRDAGRQLNVNLGQMRIRLNKGQPFLYKTPLGFKFVCIPQSKISTHLYLQGMSELAELKVARHWALPGDTCLDVGANAGYYTALLADRVGPEGRVIAVEAGPATFETLQRAVNALNCGQVLLENVCVSETNGTIDFMVAASETESVFQSMFVGTGQNYDHTSFHKVSVPAKTINSLLDEHDCHGAVSFVKMDIEGAEPLALRGAARLFEVQSLPLFIIEINQQSLRNFGFTPRDVLSYFPEELFHIYLINFNYWEPHPHYEHGRAYIWRHGEETRLPDVSNLIFVPRVGKYANRWGQISGLLAP
jgi:FkbM family methyltransferase